MKNVTKALVGAVAGLAAVLQIPAVQQMLANLAAGHKTIVILLTAAAGIAALVHDPVAPAK